MTDLSTAWTRYRSIVRLDELSPAPLIGLPLRALAPHERARVWAEERDRHLPAWALRTFYWRVLYPPIAIACRSGR